MVRAGSGWTLGDVAPQPTEQLTEIVRVAKEKPFGPRTRRWPGLRGPFRTATGRRGHARNAQRLGPPRETLATSPAFLGGVVLMLALLLDVTPLAPVAILLELIGVGIFFKRM